MPSALTFYALRHVRVLCVWLGRRVPARSSWPEAIVAMLTLTLPRELTFTCSTKGRASFWACAGRIARLRAVPARYPLVPAG
ncbi:hypothetical protein NGTWS0302_25900 [Mycolicibacterium cyprinidarum]|uniref:Uncharacterized protein n=1 Tax=Mycolicibacterium cyprinidarum TaxID=2860311 RepID=A0ABQ4VF74_9MYCO|nr:hypothetical protein NGTWS0302_25900 [Mycolicibacterium sp. NGTWS0302]GJF18245.1 hypothetical protein NGTWS1702_25920 [Mycolicibacterium sp. NGTWSNA01]